MFLVFGKTGQVASELAKVPGVLALSRKEANLLEPATCEQAIHDYKPQAVINAAAYTNVEQAEAEEDIATVVNAEAPRSMAKACAELNIPFVHLSTDYIFDGTNSKPWAPIDIPNPINAYGRGKLAGEMAIKESGAIFAIIRTSWVFSATGHNFVKTMLSLAAREKSLTIVNDQTGGPTFAADLSEFCITVANQLQHSSEKAGVYHFSGMPYVSWYEFAQEIFRQAGIAVSINGVASETFPSVAKRPINSALFCEETEAIFDFNIPDWRLGLSKVLKEIGCPK